MLNPVVFNLADRAGRSGRVTRRFTAEPEAPKSTLSNHTVLVGYGRVGEAVASGLAEAGSPFVIVEDNDETAERAREAGHPVISGNAADPRVLSSTNLAQAARLFVAVPNAFEAGQIVEQARRANPEVEIVARAHSDAEVAHLTALGARVTIMGEREIAARMLDEAFRARGGERAGREGAA